MTLESENSHSDNSQNDLEKAYLDGLVLAREMLWCLGQEKMLSVLEDRLLRRYGMCLWDLKSPVEGD